MWSSLLRSIKSLNWLYIIKYIFFYVIQYFCYSDRENRPRRENSDFENRNRGGGDRVERGERIERGERSERGERGADRGDRSDRGDRGERGERRDGRPAANRPGGGPRGPRKTFDDRRGKREFDRQSGSDKT